VEEGEVEEGEVGEKRRGRRRWRRAWVKRESWDRSEEGEEGGRERR